MLAEARRRIDTVRTAGLGEDRIRPQLSNPPTVPELLICYLEMVSRREAPANEDVRALGRILGRLSERLAPALTILDVGTWEADGPSAEVLMDPRRRADIEEKFGFLLMAERMMEWGQ